MHDIAPDKYTCFADLAAGEAAGVDYSIAWEHRQGSDVVIIAPHGGTIEPFTDTIARGIAGEDFSCYTLVAHREDSGLHLKSHLFDEPACVALVAAHSRVISIHGWRTEGLRICVGGRDEALIGRLCDALARAGIRAEAAVGHLAGTSPRNITNRGASGRGVQFELSSVFRRDPDTVRTFTRTVREVLLASQAPSRSAVT